MDSHRRHQLSQNILANWFITQYEEWIQPNGNLLSGGLLVILVLLLVYFGTTKLSERNRAKSWTQYYTAIHSEKPEGELEALADTLRGTFADQARLTLAQIQLSDGCNQLFVDKAKAAAQLEKSVEHFQRVQRSAQDKNIRLQASYGLAQAWESLAAARVGKNDLTEAETEYKKIAEQYPNEFLGEKAKKQLNLISRADTKKFLELAAAKVIEPPKSEDFKVDFNKKDPFQDGPQNFDPQKAMDGTSILKGEFGEPPISATDSGDKPKENKEDTAQKEQPADEKK